MQSQDVKKLNIPDTPGVYFFKDKEDILYIGKATSLNDRVKSYFSNDLIATRGPLIIDMIFKANKLDYIKTDSVLEALILEAELIKKHQPKYNTKEKDDRSYNYVVITKEDFPRVLIERGKTIDFKNKKLSTLNLELSTYYGPYTNGTQLKEALGIVRKIFPFRDRCLPVTISHKNLKSKKNNFESEKLVNKTGLNNKESVSGKIGQDKPCFNYQIGLCPGTCIGAISKKEYSYIIKNIKLFFEGKKTQIVKNLEREMKKFAKNQEFEKAGKIKRTIFALNHIQDISLLKSEDLKLNKQEKLRIEAYDVAHISGTANVGVMVVIENGELKKSDYRKFKIRESKQNDIAGLKEILERRLRHEEWPMPEIIVVDGGKAQINMAREILKNHKKIKVVSVLKDERHRPKAVLGDKIITSKYSNDILLANNEAHRFAVGYHRKIRSRLN